MNLNKKINSNKSKHVLVEIELEKLHTFDSIYFRGESHFENDGTQNYLVFQRPYKYFKSVSNTNNNILSWKSEGLFDESIKPPSTSNNILALGNCLFGAVKLTKHPDIDQYKYSGYLIGFDRKGFFHFVMKL